MPDLIILRLYPTKPTSAASFTNFLAGLTIDVFDLTFSNSVNGVLIGSASGLADPHMPIPPIDDSVDVNNTAIIQHYRDIPDPLTLIPVRFLEAAATAVIVVNPPAGHTEYPSGSSFDIRLEMSRGGLDIIERVTHYNVPVTNVGALSNDQTSYFAMVASTYIALPSSTVGLDPNLGFVELPANGQPPSFDALVTAINKVLAQDPGGASTLANRSPLTVAESRQVAAEIIWNRILYPAPEPARSLGDLYTRPPIDAGANLDDLEKDRKQFEAERAGYQGTHEAEALRLSGFVFAASAAVACESLSTQADRAGLGFPLITGATTGTEIPDASAILTRAGGLMPPFTVPARYFYALGALLPPQISVDQRFNMARLQDEERLLIEFQTAVDDGVITIPAAPAPNANQAARRLRAFGSDSGPAPEVPLAAPITTLVSDWLDHTGPTSDIDSAFWQGKAGSAGYRELVLRVVTRNHIPLVNAIKGPPHNVINVAGLVAITDQQWRDFFLGPSPPPGAPPRTNLLPPFTQPGSPAERVEAFIRHLRKFFAVPYSGAAPLALSMSAPPSLSMSIADIFAAFTAAYTANGGGVFQFGGVWNIAALQQAIVDVFPGDPDAQAWLLQALRTIDALFRMTNLGAATQELHFSLMEALFARGFVKVEDVLALTLAEFQEALIGTVAYPHAAAIYALVGAVGPPAPLPDTFQPVNPDGSLTDCIPPPHLSPLGPVEYLAEMLRVSPASTCEHPFPQGAQNTIGALLAGRRGPLGDLHATRANLQTPLPMIDLVNESLEFLTDGLPAATGGAVYDTAGDLLVGHLLDDGTGTVSTATQFAHDPQTLFAAIPEHSSPAVPVKEPGAYDKLKVDFTAPLLPYPQVVDINRSYLRQLKTTRFATMRRFRKDITEFVIDPNNEPAGFQRHLWRYPVRFDIAREYLGITTEEYDLLYAQDIVEAPAAGSLLLREVYGFPTDFVNSVDWFNVVLSVPEFLERTGLTYCEFIDLWLSEFVIFHREGQDPDFPECQPCCPDDLRIVFEPGQNVLIALRKLAVFIRLWRRLQEVAGPKITFNQLRDIADVLHLFNGDTINPDFIRQLAALLMLRDYMRLPLYDEAAPLAPGATGADRTHLLAIWVGPAATKWEWAVTLLLDHVQDYAEVRYEYLRRQPELIKIISENLDVLSRLSGFDPNTATDTWHADPTNTLRFIEILTKIYSSNFTVGEIIFLFTSETHLAGDDPFPLPDPGEALEVPLNVPEDDDYNLLELRKKLLAVEVSDKDAESWSWPRIENTLRDEFGFAPPPGPDPLISLGEHFFPSVLEISGHPVPVHNRQYRVNLPSVSTSPLMWNTPPDGPFRYDAIAEQLWTQVPLHDNAVVKALQEMRPLTNIEQDAVRDLYFSPRADLGVLSFIFSRFSEAVDRLVQENDEATRWLYFRREFARFYLRCRVIAEHLAAHVAAATDRENPEGYRVAWKVLRHLYADENFGQTPWEDDSGVPPNVTWGPQPNGSAFGALLGLTGTGLLTEFMVQPSTLVWRQVGDPLSGFGEARNEANAPVPTVLPSMSLTLTPEQLRFVVARNGFALRDVNGEPLGGAQPFSVRWTGALLVESGGRYSFHAGAPTAEGLDPDFRAAEDHRWRLTLRRGQKSWIILNRQWPGENAPDAHSDPLHLRPGVYHIVVELEHREPTFARNEEIRPRHSGFQIKYRGPDTADELHTVPLERLFRDQKTVTLGNTLNPGGVAERFLVQHYTSTLRDMRRTYQRAFKAVLFAHRFRLSATPIPNDRQSEFGYMLDHGPAFLGTSYPRVGPAAFDTHHAHFNLNFFPVTDPYRPPLAAADDRQQPSQRRQAALFDWWERIWDYYVMRKETRPARERPAWLLFYEASELQPDDPPQLVRHLGVDIRHADLVLNYFATPANYVVITPDLEDERWAVRVWQGEKWIRKLQRQFFPFSIAAARPFLWASDDPSVEFGAPPVSGNANLTRFLQDGYFENNAPRRYEDLTLLNDHLRVRARNALLAFLCGMDRVALPWGGHAHVPRDITDLLLQDVEVGTCQRASRIEEAISAVQTFIQRARLGLEPGFLVTPAFILLWDRHFATFYTWLMCKHREIYRENYIDWEELQKARKTEAFQFLEDELRRAALTVPIPGGLEYWVGPRPPIHPGLTVLQAREPSEIEFLTPGPLPEGLELLGTPEADARPSWLAPIRRERRQPPRDGGEPGDDDDGTPGITVSTDSPTTINEFATTIPGGTVADLAKLPLWIQAAIRLGIRFIRVAAARTPPASTSFEPRHVEPEGCCVECGRVHPALIDEYYFWLQDSRYFDPVVQDAELGAESPDDPTNDTTSDWHRRNMLPRALAWDSGPMVHLFWCRFHNGEFWQPRRSDEGVRIDSTVLAGGLPQLDFKGRTVDSLRFEVSGGVAPPGYGDPNLPNFDPTPPGFRYDIASDSAVVLPLLVAPPAPVTTSFPGGLTVYPFFAYHYPGAHLESPSMFSVGLTVGGSLRAHCRFEAALKWYEIAYKPLEHDNTWAQCPERERPRDTPPDGTTDGTPGTTTFDDTQPLDAPRDDVMVIVPRNDELPCCPTAPVNDEVARKRAVLLHYLETLLRWADALMCRNSPEAFQQATVMLNTMRLLLGYHPARIFAADDPIPMELDGFIPRPPPLNPRLLALYERSEDRLALIHNCLNGRRLRNGRPNIDMPYWGNSPFREGWQTTVDICADESDWCLTCCNAYRFLFLFQKAMELTNEVRSFGGMLLGAYEKGDAEYLASMRATQERQLLNLALEIRQNQWREADWTVQALQKTKESAQTRKRYYENLILNGLIAGEIGYQALTAVSMASRTAGNVLEAIAQAMGVVPDMWIGIAGFAGTPLQFSQLPVGIKLAANFVTAARILNALGDIANTGAGLSLTEGGWDRREDEWRHQVEVIGIEIEQIERQILAAERRRDITLRELNNHQRQIEHATEVQNFLRDKFTSHELYLFLQQETAAVYYQMFEVALHTARQAQRAFNFERGFTARTFLPTELWDNLHEGLMAGERLELALRQMEKAYLDANCREYELTKHVSVRLNFPFAFLHLMITGYCEIEIPEWMYDLDYPGQYMRRIKNVSLTIPCAVGPYSGIHCRLTLLSSKTRVDPRLIDPPVPCCDETQNRDAYQPLPDDPRIVKTYAATEAIATSSGQNDPGLFELNFRDERYLPFEFSGAISRWRIELPPENNQFDFDTLSDVVLHVNYTAREGGDVLRKVANEIAQQNLPGAGFRLFDLQHDFPSAWHRFIADPPSEKKYRFFSLSCGRDHFPFLQGNRAVRVIRMELFFEIEDVKRPTAIELVRFLTHHEVEHSISDACECHGHDIACVTSAEWPTLYHGVLDIELRQLRRSAERDLGSFRFSRALGQVTRAFLVCGYEVVPMK